ncbi:unnamed protein product, partial [Mesorhabditis spiculigera]
MRSFLVRAARAIDDLLRFPPVRPDMAFALATNVPTASTSAPATMSDLVRDMGIVWGVPKTRTTKPTKMTRKHSYTRLFMPKTDIVTCTSCGSKHLAETICGTCYEKVHGLTNEIKAKMMAYNPYKGEAQDRELHVKFSDDGTDQGVVDGRRVVELERERPSWFKKIVKS